MQSPWTFTFQDENNIWVAVEKAASPKGVVQLWRRPSASATALFVSTWTVTFSSSRPVLSIAGRWEGTSYVLYGTDSAKLYRYDATIGVPAKAGFATPVSTAPSGSAYRGVMFGGSAPFSPSRTRSASRSATPSSSKQRKVSASATKKRKALM